MFSISGYRTAQQLYESEQSLVFRAIRELDGRPVIFKVLKDIHPSPARIARFEHEYQLVKGLDLPGVVAAYELVHSSNHWVLIQEDFGGKSLAQHGLAGHIELGEFLTIAAGVASHLATIHQHAIIHKDLTPSNIVLDRSTGMIKLIDFGIATRLSREATSFGHPELVEGTPAYLSPEQTGRTSQPLDHRTDLYSFGCTLYELLTGRLPFEGTELIELIHCHLARRPESIQSLRPEVPAVVEAIIDKLLAKNANDRYQSAEGAAADLRRCLERWEASGTIETFELGTQDVARRLMPSSRLYGRNEEIERLTATFERVARGATEVLMISGGAGIGKSSLVKELYTPVTRDRGFFVSGKFDQYQRATPYLAIIQMIDELIGQVLMEPPDQAQQWATVLDDAAGIMLPVLVTTLPRLELLYERLPPPPALSVEEQGYRFKRALARCIRAFASKEHPLVLFVDDLQWADSASLELIKVLLLEGEAPYLMVIGASRDQTTPATQSLRNVLVDVRAASVSVQELQLQPLSPGDTTALISDTLGREPESMLEATSVIHDKTGGNPFFIHAFLETLLAKGVLSLDQSSHSWQLDIERLRLLESSDNVIDLLIENMQRLPRSTHELVTHASCIGNRFELALLAAVVGRPEHEVAESLTPALQKSYLIPIKGRPGSGSAEVGIMSYKFAHDRVQQAAYGLDEDAHAEVHLRIGRTMKARLDGSSDDPLLLATAGQLNRALELIHDAKERREIASINNLAGMQAMRSVAHAAAVDHFQHGLSFLGGSDQAFEQDRSLALELATGVAHASYLDADFERTKEFLELSFRHSSGTIERVAATMIRINALTAQNELQQALDVARELLASLGVMLPAEPTIADADAMFRSVEETLGGRDVASLIDLPEMTDPNALAALRVLGSVYVSAFLTKPAYTALIAAHFVLLSLAHGVAEESAQGFIYYGMALSARGRESLSCEYGTLAEALIEQRRFDSQLPILAVLNFCYILHWQRPLRGAISKMRNAYAVGLERGQLELGVNCLFTSTVTAYLAGYNLQQIDELFTECTPTLLEHKQLPYLNLMRIYHQSTRNLRGLSSNPTLLQGDIYDEVTDVPMHERVGDLSSLYMVRLNKLIISYHFHEYADAQRAARDIEGGNQPGSIWLAVTRFYQCLVALAACDGATPEQRASLIEDARPLIEEMKRWGASCAVNYQHKYHLMVAELCRVSNETMEARRHYDRAADLARAHEYTQEEGLAFERAALFYLEQDNPRLASYYMSEAYYAFERWGAEAKLAFLRERHSDLLGQRQDGRGRPPARATGAAERTTSTTTTGGSFGELDLATVLAASRAIVGETNVDALLQTVMRISLENAGAERGYLLLARGERLLVKVHAELGEHAVFESVSRELDDQAGLAHAVVRYVARTAEPVVLHDAAVSGQFVQDLHIRSTGCKSVLCLPIQSHGRLIAISYLENNRASAVFDADRLDVLTLLMGQAAISVENALLREADDVRDFHFRVGGSLPANSPTYVRREADELLAGNIRRGEFCYVFNTRQMGKSSLRVQTMERLRRDGVACVSVDISSIGSHGTTPQQWYVGIARALVASLGLQRDINLRSWWRDKDELSPVQRLDILIDEEILARVETPIAVFIDEVDATLALDFSADDFFALIRLFYNRRAEDPRYQRLSITLFGVATPSDLIRDGKITPFNIGRAIPLSGFRFDEARHLVTGLAHLGDGTRILRAVLEWSCGQPFLTQKLCSLLSEEESRPVAGKEREWVASLVRRRVIDKWRHHDEPRHLGTIESRMLQSAPSTTALLQRYLEILEHGEVDGDDSPLDTVLVLSGIVNRAYDKIRVGNPIYSAVFDRLWVENAISQHQ